MITVKSRYAILTKIIAMALVCLLSIETVAWAYPQEYTSSIPKDTLQVQSIFKTILPSVGHNDKLQIQLEAAIIAQMIASNHNIPCQNINAVITDWRYS